MKIILTGQPRSTQHIYHFTCRGRFGKLYMIAEGKQLKKQYQSEIEAQWNKEIITGDCSIKIDLFFQDKRKRDIDNFNKLILDSLENIVLENDNQIQELNIRKFYDKENPRIEIEIEELK